MRAPLLVVAVLSSFALAGCGKEVGRVHFSGEGSSQAPAALKAGEVAFWTDIDIAYRGDAALAYRIDLVQDGAPVASTICDPLGRIAVKTSWTETNLGGSHSRHGNGKMGCSLTLAKGGPTTVKATLAFGRKPANLVLKRADLVLKQ